jgi:hypothetical protein
VSIRKRLDLLYRQAETIEEKRAPDNLAPQQSGDFSGDLVCRRSAEAQALARRERLVSHLGAMNGRAIGILARRLHRN